MRDASMTTEYFKLYEDGKHRRYELLFAVNGGAFAIAKILGDKTSVAVLGHLSHRELSAGMILFTLVMVFDIYMFGEKMRSGFLPGAFSWQGKAVLILIGTLICAGWFLAA